MEVPTYPKYNIGGWIAKAGSCKIGFRPNPSLGTGSKRLNGFEVKIKNKKKPVIISCWKKIVKNLYLIGCFFEKITNKKINKVSTNNHSNKLPSWFPQDPEIL